MSESEFERLYQEFVRKGGGTYTFDGSAQTPAAYYDLTSLTELSDSEIAQLEAAQEQYNRQAALNTISTELAANAFTNPFNLINQSGRNAYIYLSTNPNFLLIEALNVAINGSANRQDILDYFISSGIGTSFLSLPSLPLTASSMYDLVQSHTDSQVSNLVQTLQDVNSLVNMSKQFGEQDSSCNMFNELMGLLSGSFDGVFNYLEGITKPITDFINSVSSQISNITSLIQNGVSNLVSQITNALSPVINTVKSAMNAVGDIVSKATGFISDITNQVAKEAAGLLNLASNLLEKAKALAIAAASFDVCQLAVLMRTGSNQLTSALSQFATPLSSPLPTVPTSIDPRANPISVQSAVSSARQSSLTAMGVPQSPLRGAVTLYNPISAYLTSALNKITEPLNDAFSTIQSVTGQVNVVKNALSNFQSGGSVNGISSDDSSIPTGSPQMVKSKAFNTYSSTYMNSLLKRKTDLKNLRLEITNGTSRTDVPYTTAVKGQAKTIIESLALTESSISSMMTAHTKLLTYVSIDGKRNQDIEDFAKEEYETNVSPNTVSLLSSSKRVYDSSLSWWNSVKI
jgi:uncharacterized protein YoxC